MGTGCYFGPAIVINDWIYCYSSICSGADYCRASAVYPLVIPWTTPVVTREWNPVGSGPTCRRCLGHATTIRLATCFLCARGSNIDAFGICS